MLSSKYMQQNKAEYKYLIIYIKKKTELSYFTSLRGLGEYVKMFLIFAIKILKPTLFKKTARHFKIKIALALSMSAIVS